MLTTEFPELERTQLRLSRQAILPWGCTTLTKGLRSLNSSNNQRGTTRYRVDVIETGSEYCICTYRWLYYNGRNKTHVESPPLKVKPVVIKPRGQRATTSNTPFYGTICNKS